MHQPDIDGERPFNDLKLDLMKFFKTDIQSTVITLKPYDSAVKHIFDDNWKFLGYRHQC